MKKMLLYFIVFTIGLMCFWSQASYSGVTGKIRGIVTDKKTGEPLPGANVIIKGTSLGASSALDGTFFILLVPPGRRSLEVKMMGYKASI
ncbi:MAG: hypothetical protein GWP06_13615, partial [Actinobacteria bacterium]|nr:hypothetical protein [Actinomycetota bacterium]